MGDVWGGYDLSTLVKKEVKSFWPLITNAGDERPETFKRTPREKTHDSSKYFYRDIRVLLRTSKLICFGCFEIKLDILLEGEGWGVGGGHFSVLQSVGGSW